MFERFRAFQSLTREIRTARPAPLDESGRQLVKIHVSDDSNFLSPLLHQRSAHVVLRDGRIFGTQYKASASGHAFRCCLSRVCVTF